MILLWLMGLVGPAWPMANVDEYALFFLSHGGGGAALRRRVGGVSSLILTYY